MKFIFLFAALLCTYQCFSQQTIRFEYAGPNLDAHTFPITFFVGGYKEKEFSGGPSIKLDKCQFAAMKNVLYESDSIYKASEPGYFSFTIGNGRKVVVFVAENWIRVNSIFKEILLSVPLLDRKSKLALETLLDRIK